MFLLFDVCGLRDVLLLGRKKAWRVTHRLRPLREAAAPRLEYELADNYPASLPFRRPYELAASRRLRVSFIPYYDITVKQAQRHREAEPALPKAVRAARRGPCIQKGTGLASSILSYYSHTPEEIGHCLWSRKRSTRSVGSKTERANDSPEYWLFAPANGTSH